MLLPDFTSSNIEKSITVKTSKEENVALLNVKGLVLNSIPRKDGRYMGRLKNEDGGYDCFYAKTREELERKALKLIQENSEKNKKFSGKYTVKLWLEKWSNLYHAQKVSPTVLKQDVGIIKNHILPNIGEIKLDKLSALDLQELINKIERPRLKQFTALLLTAALRKAYELDIIKKDITKAVEKPRHHSKEGRALTSEEQNKLLKAIKGIDIENIIILLLNSGLRRNEALGLQFKHLNFEKDEIKVEQQITGGGNVTNVLKTKSSKRTVKMFPIIKSIFEPIKKSTDEFLFNFKPNYLTHKFADICKTQDIKDFHLHNLRTTFATNCEYLGISAKVVQTWLGHSKIDTTVNIYQKTNTDLIEKEFKKVLNNNFDTKNDTESD